MQTPPTASPTDRAAAPGPTAPPTDRAAAPSPTAPRTDTAVSAPADRAAAPSPTAPIASIPGAVAASLAIRVDITDWPLEKIQGLFALIRGADLRLRLETP